MQCIVPCKYTCSWFSTVNKYILKRLLAENLSSFLLFPLIMVLISQSCPLNFLNHPLSHLHFFCSDHHQGVVFCLLKQATDADTEFWNYIFSMRSAFISVILKVWHKGLQSLNRESSKRNRSLAKAEKDMLLKNSLSSTAMILKKI